MMVQPEKVPICNKFYDSFFGTHVDHEDSMYLILGTAGMVQGLLCCWPINVTVVFTRVCAKTVQIIVNFVGEF
jgi:hypothetical protein